MKLVMRSTAKQSIENHVSIRWAICTLSKNTLRDRYVQYTILVEEHARTSPDGGGITLALTLILDFITLVRDMATR